MIGERGVTESTLVGYFTNIGKKHADDLTLTGKAGFENPAAGSGILHHKEPIKNRRR